MDELASALEKRVAQAYSQELMVRQRSEKLAAMLALLSGGRQNLQALLLEFDQTLEGLGKRDEQAQAGASHSGVLM